MPEEKPSGSQQPTPQPTPQPAPQQPAPMPSPDARPAPISNPEIIGKSAGSSVPNPDKR